MPRDIQRLRIVGMLEGVSFLLLLGIAMPLKYAMDWPWAVKLLGPVHGVLFVLYLVLVVVAWRQHAWGFARVVTFAVASLLPFGPLLVDRQLKTDWR
jgi:integral membrane protein